MCMIKSYSMRLEAACRLLDDVDGSYGYDLTRMYVEPKIRLDAGPRWQDNLPGTQSVFNNPLNVARITHQVTRYTVYTISTSV